MNFDPTGGPLAPPSDDEIARRHSIKPSKTSKIIKLSLGFLVFVAIVGGGVVGAIKLLGKKSNDNVVTAPPTVVPDKIVQTMTNDIPDVTETKVYENSPMGLKLTYPASWKATNTGDQGVRIESPDFTYATIDEGEVKGNFRIYIRKGARPADGKIIGRGVAIRSSEKLVYGQPVLDQRKETLLSLFGLDTTNNFAFFLIAGNFALQPGDTLGPDYGKEADAFIVGGGFSAEDLAEDMATHTVAISSLATSKAYAQALDILKSLQLR